MFSPHHVTPMFSRHHVTGGAPRSISHPVSPHARKRTMLSIMRTSSRSLCTSIRRMFYTVRVAHDASTALVSCNKGDGVRAKMITPCSFWQNNAWRSAAVLLLILNLTRFGLGPLWCFNLCQGITRLTRYLHSTSYMSDISTQVLHTTRCTI